MALQLREARLRERNAPRVGIRVPLRRIEVRLKLDRLIRRISDRCINLRQRPVNVGVVGFVACQSSRGRRDGRQQQLSLVGGDRLLIESDLRSLVRRVSGIET